MKLGYLATAAVAAFTLAAPSFAIDKGGPIVIDPMSNSGPFGATHSTPTEPSGTAFTDTYTFTTTLSGTVAAAAMSISVTTANYLNLTTAQLNGGAAVNFTSAANGSGGFTYTATVFGPINTAPASNSLVIKGVTVGAGGTYSGNVSLTAAVPEIATWAMMVIGFGAVGGAMRTSRRKVVFA